MSTANRIIKNAMSNGAGLVCEAVIAFSMLPYIIHRIGESAYGVWVFTIAISGYMGILNLGFRPTVNKYVSQYNATGDWKKIREILQGCLSIYFICGLIIFTICLFLSYNLSIFFNIPAEFESIAPLLVLLVGIQMPLGLLAVVYGGVISGLQRYELNNAIEIFVMLSRTVIILIFLNELPSLLTLAAAHFSMTIFGYLLTVIVAKKLADIKGINLFKRPSKEALTAIFKFSSITFVIAMVGRIVMYIDAPLIAAVLTTTAVTYYAVGSRLVNYTKNLVEVLVNVLAPATSELQAMNQLDTIKKVYFFSSRICSYIVFPILLYFIVSGHDFIKLWIGQSYPESYHVLLVFSLAGLIIFPQMSTTPILFGLAKHRILMNLIMIEGVLSIGLAIVLGHMYGLIGMAIGLAAPKALISSLICPVYVARLLGANWRQWFVVSYIKGGLVVIPFTLTMFLIRHYLILDNWLFTLFLLMVSSSVHLLSIWLFGLNQFERDEGILKFAVLIRKLKKIS